MPQLGFESTIPVCERWETFHALDRAAPYDLFCGIMQGINICEIFIIYNHRN
jgi:hypothetical protein